jgi:hypothetical protein
MNKFFTYLLLFIFSCFGGITYGQSPTIFNGGLRFNGTVLTQTTSGGITYFGGNFTSIQSKTGALANINLTNFQPNLNVEFQKINGSVRKVISDGAGGYYVGGSFTYSNGTSTFYNLIRISSTNVVSVVGNNASAGAVNDLLLVSGKLFVMRSNGVSRLNIASNTYDFWSIQGDGRCAMLTGNYIYLGGRFLINGSYTPLIRLVVSTLNLDSWSAGISSTFINGSTNMAYINSFAFANGILYYGGLNIKNVNGLIKSELGSIIASNGNHTTFDVRVSGTAVYSIAIVGNNLFVGGAFSSMRSTGTSSSFPRNNLGLVSLTNNQVSPTWNPSPNGPVSSLSTNGSALNIGGSFTSVAGFLRSNFALFNAASTGSPTIHTTAKPNPNGPVFFTGTVGTQFFVGGQLSEIRVSDVLGIAAINSLTGIPVSFNAQITSGGSVNTIHVAGSNIYIGGAFVTVNNVSRMNFAVVNTIGNLNTAINVSFNNTVRCITSSGTDIFVGGDFTSATNVLNGIQFPRNFLVKFSIANSQLVFPSIFNASLVSGSNVSAVRTVKIINGELYVGGQFSSPKNKVAKLNASNGSALLFDAKIIGTTNVVVNDIIFVNPGQIAVAGNFPSGFNQTVFNPSNTINYGAANLGGVAIFNNSSGNLISRNTDVSSVNQLVKQFTNSIEYVDQTGVKSYSLINGVSNTVLNTTNIAYSIAYLNSQYVYTGSFSGTSPVSNFKYIGVLNYIPPTAPTNPSSNFFVSNLNYNSLRLNFTPGNGARRIVIAKQNSYATALPISGSSYISNNSFGLGSMIGGGYVVYDGSGNFADVTNLSPLTTYYFRVIEYNGTGINTMYGANFLQGIGTTLDFPTPTTSASGINFPSVSQTSLTMNWTRGNGNSCLVVAKSGGPVDFIPTSNSNYSVNAGFGFAPVGNNNFALYKGSANSMVVTNLTPGVTYHFAVYEFNQFNNLIRYRTINPAVGNITTSGMANPPTIAASGMSFNNLSSSITNVLWSSNGNGNRRLVLGIQGIFAPTNIYTTNGLSYTDNANFSGSSPLASQIMVRGILNGVTGNYNAKVLYNGTGNNVPVTGLLSNTNYTYMVVEYNQLGTNTNSSAYLTNPILVGTKKTDQNLQPPSVSASSPKSIETNNSMRLRWTNGNGSNRIVVMRQSLPVNFVPTDNMPYPANSNFTLGTDLGFGQKIVYNGNTGASVDITGLQPYTTYHFAIYEYNSIYNVATSSMEIAYRTIACSFNGKTAPANWPRIAGGAETDASGSVAVDASGNVYVTGTVRGNVNFGLTELNANSNDIFLAKYTSTGDLLWVKLAGGVGDDASAAVVLDGNSNAYIVGSYRNSATFDTITLTSVGNDDGFIAKYTSSGNAIWAKTFGSTSQDVANALAIDGAGNLLVGGFHSGTTNFAGTSTSLTTNGNSDLLIAKYNQSGALLWAKGGGSAGYDFAFSIGADQNNNVYACGEVKGVGTFGSVSSTHSAAADAILVKFDASGNPQYANAYGSAGDDKAMFLDVDGNGNVYMVGTFSNTVSFGTNSILSAGITDGYLVKITGANGSVQWVKQQGGVSQDITSGVDIGTNGEIFITGSFGGTANFETQSLTSLGSQDIFVAIYSSTGILNVARRYGGPLDDAARGIYAIIPNNTYISGYFNTTASFGGFDVNTKVQPLPPNGNWDVFIHNIGATYNSDPSADLISWHRLNGNANDFSVNGFNGTVFSPGSPNIVSSINDRNGAPSSAFNFSGTGRVDFNISNNANYNNLNEVTVMGWIKVASFSGASNFVDRGIIGSDEATGMSFSLQVTPDQGVFGQFTDNTSVCIGIAASPQYAYQAGTWAHVALTYENGVQTRIYLNGSVVGTTGAFVLNKTCDLANRHYTIGAIGSSASGPFTNYYSMNGGIDDVRIYKRALSAVQIQDIMLSASNISAPPQENKAGKLAINDGLNVWPNPSNGNITVELINESEQLISFIVVDLSGKIVYQESATSFEAGIVRKTLDLQGMPAGFYTLQVVKGNELKNYKLMFNN